MTLLTAINRAQRRLSLEVTSVVVADGQETQNLLFELAVAASEDILQREYWPQLRRTQSFSATTGATLQSGGRPSNFDRAVRDTFWNVSQDRQISGPLTDQEWALVNGEPVVSSITQFAMFRYDGLHLWPAPTVADTITFDYIINTPVLAVDGITYKTAFTLDSDSFVLGDRLLALAVRWMYLAEKGRDYAEAMRDFEFALGQELGKQRGAARKLMLAQPDIDPLLEGINVPDTGFGA